VIVDARLKMKWSIIHTITTGTSTILQKIAQWESHNHSGTEGVHFTIKVQNLFGIRFTLYFFSIIEDFYAVFKTKGVIKIVWYVPVCGACCD